jgi:hypothetical protein
MRTASYQRPPRDGTFRAIILSVNPGLGVQIVDDCFYANCPPGLMIAATITVLNMPGEICFAPTSIGGWNCTWDCAAEPVAWGNTWTGYANDGSASCSQNTPEPCANAVEVREIPATAWGRVKTMYR